MEHKEHNFKRLILLHVITWLLWLIFYVNFSSYYDSVEILISDYHPIIEKVLMFMTYSKVKSIVYIGVGFVVISFLMGVTLKAVEAIKELKNKPKIKGMLSLIVILNLAMLVAFYRPIVYPLFIILTGISGTIFYVAHVFNKEGIYEEDYEESYYEENDEKDCEEENEKQN